MSSQLYFSFDELVSSLRDHDLRIEFSYPEQKAEFLQEASIAPPPTVTVTGTLYDKPVQLAFDYIAPVRATATTPRCEAELGCDFNPLRLSEYTTEVLRMLHNLGVGYRIVV